MKPHNPGVVYWLLAGALCLMLGAFAGQTCAQTKTTVADQLAEAITNYSNLEFDKGIEATRALLARSDIGARDSIAIYSVMSMLTYGKGEDYIKKSYDYLRAIAGIGPCAIHLPYEFWPQQLRDEWFKLMQVKGTLICPQESQAGIKTIAIMEFDNYSTGKYQQELGFITKGLADFFENDFAKISSLRVVERDKIDFLLKELELSKGGAVEAATAVKIGRLLGAQIMVFGTIVQLDEKTCKMLVKAVNVETSEIIASAEKEGKPDYFKMQKELVGELAAKLNVTVNEATKTMLDEGTTSSADAATLYSKGLYYMDQYDYKKAFDFFKAAYDTDNSFVEAKRKMDIYRPLAIS